LNIQIPLLIEHLVAKLLPRGRLLLWRSLLERPLSSDLVHGAEVHVLDLDPRRLDADLGDDIQDRYDEASNVVGEEAGNGPVAREEEREAGGDEDDEAEAAGGDGRVWLAPGLVWEFVARDPVGFETVVEAQVSEADDCPGNDS